MRWNKAVIEAVAKPEPPGIAKWFAAIAAVLMFAVSAFNLISLLRPGLITISQVAAVTAAVIAVLMLMLFMRYLIYSHKNNSWHAWQQESQQIEAAWQVWAARYIALVKSYVFLPGNITANTIAKAEERIETSAGLVKKIDYLDSDAKSTVQTLLGSVKNALAALPRQISIELLLVSNLEQQQQKELLLEAEIWWQQSLSDVLPQPTMHTTEVDYYTELERWLKTPQECVKIYLIVQHSEDNKFSDASGVFVMTADDVAEKHQLPASNKIYRPMLSGEEHFAEDYRTLITTQPTAKSATACYCADKQAMPLTVTMLQQSLAEGGELKVEHIRDIERFVGLPGPCAAWLAAGLASDTALVMKSECLMLAKHHSGWFIHAVQSLES